MNTFCGKQHIIFDIEVFKTYWLVVALIKESKTFYHFDTLESLRKFYEQHKTDIWIGYNVNHYDSYVLKIMLMGYGDNTEYIKSVSDYLIKGNGWELINTLDNEIPNFKRDFYNVKLITYDVMKGKNESLKKLEGYMGEDIKETSIPFNIDRELTNQEKQEVLQYCINDVIATARVLSYRVNDFKQQKWLINNFNLEPKHLNRTKAQLTAIILGAKAHERKDEFKGLVYPEFVEGEYCERLKRWFADKNNQPSEENREVSTVITVGDMPVTFGWGGCHGAIDNYYGEGDFYNVDVASYYPSIMIEYDLLSRNVKDKSLFKQIVEQRLEYKRKGDKAEKALKIVVNGTYGASGDKFNDLYDSKQMREVCIFGQLMLLDLITRLEGKAQLVNINTDGLLLKITNTPFEELKPILEEWQLRTRMKLEIDKYIKVVQRDVNNYVIVSDTGKEKGKGALMKELTEIDYNLPIIQKAVKERLLRSIPIGETIYNCNDLREFQQIAHITDKFEYCELNEQRLPYRTNRVFASTRETDSILYKCRTVEGELQKAKYQGTPTHCFINNGKVAGVLPPEYLDKNYYIELAEKELKQFIGGK